jgi:hypothetical protein
MKRHTMQEQEQASVRDVCARVAPGACDRVTDVCSTPGIRRYDVQDLGSTQQMEIEGRKKPRKGHVVRWNIIP